LTHALRHAPRIASAAACALVAAACAGRAPAPPPADPGPFERDAYVIGAADVLRIHVWKNEELSLDVPVRPDGKISMPLLDDVQAAGLTAQELKEVIAKALSEYVTAPDVTVIVTAVNSKFVYVVGGVLRPSAIPLNVDMRALDAIAVVGGFNTFADKSRIKILRSSADGNVVEYRFDYAGFLKGQHLESNLLLRPGDTIVVPD
jgi:polysaccharide export outer membrane protein